MRPRIAFERLKAFAKGVPVVRHRGCGRVGRTRRHITLPRTVLT